MLNLNKTNQFTRLIFFKMFLWYFGRFKVFLINYVRPKLLEINDDYLIIKIPLSKRNKNHLQSMYFGTLAIGADLAGGLFGFYYAKIQKLKVSIAFKSFHAEFIKRPTSEVFFVNTMGKEIAAMLEESKLQQRRINKNINVTAYINYPHAKEEAAKFVLELSVKVLQ